MPDVPGLATLARLYGVQTSFSDVDGRRRLASAEALLGVIRALGAPIETVANVPNALRERRHEVWTRRLEPVIVAWQGRPANVDVRLPAAAGDRRLRCELTFEDGGVRRWTSRESDRELIESAEIEGKLHNRYRLPLPTDLPAGYHRLVLELDGDRTESLVIAAPTRAFRRPGAGRSWGVFAPLYALRSDRNWGAGDFADLRSLMEWTGELGSGSVATLPLLAAFLDEPFEPSPYVPASRLFWNEIYLDMESVPELGACEPARALVASAAFQRDVKRLRDLPSVDHRALARLKRSMIERLSHCFFSHKSSRREELERFADANPDLRDYARFRAVTQKRGVPWHAWPGPLRDGALSREDSDADAERYHLYVQWLVHEQMSYLVEDHGRSNVGLHLDMPLGTHPDGYDVWRERELFAQDISVGAPPDTLFAGGQDWGFRPPNPEAQRAQGYRHFRACLTHHLRYCGSLRIDHVMGLHRLYWIPRAGGSREGVYVRYPDEELYAIICLESHRHEAEIVGEDLGTVPREVRRSMGRHGFTRSYVLQIESSASTEEPFGEIPRDSVASLNTHDTPTFAAYWTGGDTAFKRTLGVIDSQMATAERRSRQEHKKALVAFLTREGLLDADHGDEATILEGCLAYLASSRARMLLITLEDLWLETESQNVPGTSNEHPNWQRKARHTIEEIRNAPEFAAILRDVNHRRNQG